MSDALDIEAWMQDSPDPPLLPLLARHVPVDEIWRIAELAAITGDRGGVFPPWPPIAEQTAQALASRWREFPASVQRDVLQSLPRAALYLPGAVRAAILDQNVADFPALAACLVRVSGDRAAAATLAAQYIGAADPCEARGLSLIVPLLSDPDRSAALDLVVNDTSAFALRGWMDLAHDELLTGREWSVIEPVVRELPPEPRLAAAAALAPFADEADARLMLRHFAEIAPGDVFLADWFVASMLISSGRWIEATSRRLWVESIGEPYEAYVAKYLEDAANGTAAGTESFAALDSLPLVHPGAGDVELRLNELPAEQAGKLAGRASAEVFDRWAGAPPQAGSSGAGREAEALSGPESTPAPRVTEPPAAHSAASAPAHRVGRSRSLWSRIRGIVGPRPAADAVEPSRTDESDDLRVRRKRRKATRGGPRAFRSSPPPKRFVQAAIARGGQRRLTFVAGEPNNIVCWIGPKDTQDTRPRAESTESIREDAVPEDGMLLDVVLTFETQSSTGRIWLPKDGRLRTGECILTIDVPADEVHIIAEIAFLFQGRAFEIVRIDAPVLQAAEDEAGVGRLRIKTQAQRREVIELTDREPIDAVALASDSKLVVFGARGSRSFELRNSARAVEWLNDELFATEKSLVRKRGDEADAEPVIAADDAETLAFLRDMALHGNSLYKDLMHQGFEDPGEHIQLLNLEPTAYVPLEFIYDRGHPVEGATLCDGWAAALAGDDYRCPSCKPAAELSLEERDAMATICPLGFWSLQKIIERHDQVPEDDDANPSVPTDRAAQLPPITRALFASSDRVQQADRDLAFAALSESFEKAVPVDSWEGWKRSVHDEAPQLLVALPHHAVTGNIDVLEIGNGDQLLQDRLSELYVTSTDSRPGPVVILLGCETQRQAEMGYVSFAREFTRHRAAVVVGTMARVLGRHAAPAVESLVRELGRVSEPERIGVILRRLRRRMLAQGYLMSLCLVALGDGDWRLSPAAARTTSPEP